MGGMLRFLLALKGTGAFPVLGLGSPPVTLLVSVLPASLPVLLEITSTGVPQTLVKPLCLRKDTQKLPGASLAHLGTADGEGAEW